MNAGKQQAIVMTCYDPAWHPGCYSVPSVRSSPLDRLAATGARFAPDGYGRIAAAGRMGAMRGQRPTAPEVKDLGVAWCERSATP
jgi:hypothetical protein